LLSDLVVFECLPDIYHIQTAANLSVNRDEVCNTH
jgi:hypothetical protein